MARNTFISFNGLELLQFHISSHFCCLTEQSVHVLHVILTASVSNRAEEERLADLERRDALAERLREKERENTKEDH